jgi:glutamate racemase
LDGVIAIFDSGVGGLTVLAEVARLLPHENVLYLGDTARVPYGTKSRRTVIRFSEENCFFLLRFRPKLIVVACNTATASALPILREKLPVPVVGVVEPGARAAAESSRTGVIGIMGTETTISSSTYERTIHQFAPGAELLARACPLLVPMVEEGRTSDDPLVGAVLGEYLADFRNRGDLDTLVLGCTHYPLVAEAVARAMGNGVRLVDSAVETARDVKRVLGREGILNPSPDSGSYHFLASDNPERFRAVGSRFLARPIERVQYVSPEEFFNQGGRAIDLERELLKS